MTAISMEKYVIDHNDTITDKKVLVKYIGAFLLGDGCLTLPGKRSKNPIYRLSQLTLHKDYVDWQCEILANLTSVSVYKQNAYVREGFGNIKAQFKVATKSHPLYSTLYDRFYLCGRKIVSPHDLKLFDWEVAAIWYMDDGSLSVEERKKENYVKAVLCTDCFSFGDVSLLQKVLYERLGIPFNINKRGNGYRLIARKDYAKKFIDGVKPYILPSFEYKLSYD